MVFLSLLLLVATEDPSERAIATQARKCGLEPNQLVWSTNKRGERWAYMTPNGDLDSMPFERFACMLRWAQETGAKVGFVAEPPPVTPEHQP